MKLKVVELKVVVWAGQSKQMVFMTLTKKHYVTDINNPCQKWQYEVSFDCAFIFVLRKVFRWPPFSFKIKFELTKK